MSKWGNVRQFIDHPRFKFPPLLGDGQFLLVESDTTEYFDSHKCLNRDTHYVRRNMAAANEAGYSLILVPEHQTVWREGSPRPTPDAVSQRLAEVVQDWNGEHIVLDLGEEMGVYQEGMYFDPEVGQGRRLERK